MSGASMHAYHSCNQHTSHSVLNLFLSGRNFTHRLYVFSTRPNAAFNRYIYMTILETPWFGSMCRMLQKRLPLKDLSGDDGWQPALEFLSCDNLAWQVPKVVLWPTECICTRVHACVRIYVLSLSYNYLFENYVVSVTRFTMVVLAGLYLFIPFPCVIAWPSHWSKRSHKAFWSRTECWVGQSTLTW